MDIEHGSVLTLAPGRAQEGMTQRRLLEEAQDAKVARIVRGHGLGPDS
ncbi:hypothetical protein ARTHRO8AJ_60075 [Arthrobacter sp. 8AJ]|nr:hypothetical protein ARTHRO8AJ_60075 [Arthrobacter sp. 8AJ]